MKKAFKILAVTTLSLTLALPFTTYAGTWQQDSTGWRVQSDDGTYLTNQWYQSPESGLFYYLGADGYMMINATTPDGYQVDANGVCIQPTKPEQSNNNSGGIDTSGWDLGGGSVTVETGVSDQSLSPEEYKAINEIQFN
ncbi:hypothetical protein [Enterocloster bolteae]|uniref:hypothetical protein n=1 Tax=Enterocloster bolteae TaxID=208479 RepID=UPI002A815CA7|nr:hypothetical protein [Enterocloster bolteae]